MEAGAITDDKTMTNQGQLGKDKQLSTISQGHITEHN